MKIWIPLTLALFCSTLAFANGDLRCEGNGLNTPGATLTLGSRVSRGDIDNDFHPYCVSDARLVVGSKITHGDLLESESDSTGEPQRIIISMGAGHEFTLIRDATVGRGVYLVNGEPARQVVCKMINVQPDDCQL